MPIKDLNPYLFFDGTAEPAMQLYERALGAKIEDLMRFGDVSGDAHPCQPEDRQRVMHASVRVGPTLVMVSDSPAATPPAKSSNVEVCLSYDDVAEMRRAFEALAEGGQVTMALQDTFWNATFGTLVDRFGIHWMFNCQKADG